MKPVLKDKKRFDPAQLYDELQRRLTARCRLQEQQTLNEIVALHQLLADPLLLEVATQKKSLHDDMILNQ